MSKTLDTQWLKNIPFTAAEGIDLEGAKATSQFQEWADLIGRERDFTIKSIHFQSIDMFGKKWGFIKFKADVTDAQGQFIPGIVFMRGGSVGILPILECEGVEHVILTVQSRVAAASFDYEEIPAGMLDGSGNFNGVAADELQQELGLVIADGELFDLTEFAGYRRGFVPSAGGCDETVRLFCFKRKVSRETLDKINGRCTGLAEEGEKISLKVALLADLWRLDDAKSVVAFTLYLKAKEKGAYTTEPLELVI